MTSPLVTVIVPNYNHAQFLDIRITSILEQTYDNFEVILLDDASTDNSREILSKYQDEPRISSVIFNKKNSGTPFLQWEKGIKEANGELIWIAESDDFADPEFLSTIVPYFQRDEEIVLAYCQSFNTDEDGLITGSRLGTTARFNNQKWWNSFEIDGKELLRDYLSKVNVIPNASAVVFKKSCFKGIHPEAANVRRVADWITWAYIVVQGRVAYECTHLNYFRFSPNNTRKIDSIRDKQKVYIEYLRALNAMKSLIPEDVYEKQQIYLMWKWVSMHSILQLNRHFREFVNYSNVTLSVLYYTYLKRLYKLFKRNVIWKLFPKLKPV